MTNIEGKKISQTQITAADSNAEYVYIIEDKEVWFIDYVIGIAFKCIHWMEKTEETQTGILLLLTKQGRKWIDKKS